MFGSAGRLEKKLRESGGKAAPAEITAAKKGMMAISTGNDAAQQAASAHVNWKLTLRVTPDSESPFEAEVKEPYPEMGGGPSVGDVIGVLYDPNDHTKLVIDHSTEGIATQALSHMSPEAQAALSSVGGESAGDLVKEALADPTAFREKMRAAGSGPIVMVGGQQISGAPVAAKPIDPADEIAKLADLRDRGALTPDEFEAQKKRVLGG
jgi:hypothetical protein